MKHKLQEYLPVGMDGDKLIKKALFIYFVPIIYSMQYIVAFIMARSEQIKMTKRMGEIVAMESFTSLLGTSFWVFPFAIVGLLAIIWPLYSYHLQGSKSIYVMKRLPDSMELWRRTLTLPMVSAICCLITAILLWGVYYGIYIIFSPKGSIVVQGLSVLS